MRYSVHCVFLIVIAGFFSAGCFGAKARVNDPTDLRGYLESARRPHNETNDAEGSLWTGNGHYSGLYQDPKARFVDDMVTIVVSESTQAVASADAKNSKNTQMTAGFDKLFGLEKKINELPTLVSGKSNSSYEGAGSTTRETVLQTTLTARVVDVLSNGYLVVEGMREIRVNNENQTICLTGVIRPEDISANNAVPSSAVAQMSVQVQGRGVVSQPLKPGWLYRILMGIMPF